jgi:hypothetical protein
MNKLKSIINRLSNSIVNQLYSDKIFSHRLVFCINSGRSGSQYLAELLGTAEEVISYHEPQPPMTGDFLSLINNNNYSDSLRVRKIKSHTIKNVIRNFPEGKIYCETNHMFIKTFFDIVCKDFKKIDVIILRRYLPSVLKSFIELGYFSEKNPNWPLWMSSPNAVTAAISCLDKDENLDQYDRCIAYLIDIEARAIRFQKEYPLIPTHEVRLESLNNYEQIKELFKRLKITPTKNTEAIYTEKINQRSGTKIKYQEIPVSLNYCEERINRYINLATEKGIVIPSSLALKPFF